MGVGVAAVFLQGRLAAADPAAADVAVVFRGREGFLATILVGLVSAWMRKVSDVPALRAAAIQAGGLPRPVQVLPVIGSRYLCALATFAFVAFLVVLKPKSSAVRSNSAIRALMVALNLDVTQEDDGMGFAGLLLRVRLDSGQDVVKATVKLAEQVDHCVYRRP